jgi:hypothetical protein
MADPADRTAAPEADPLAWEAQNARRAGTFALVAAILHLLGSLTIYLVNRGAPSGEGRVLTLIDTLSRAAAGQPEPPGAKALIFAYTGRHATLLIVATILVGLGTLATFPPLAYLYRATRARVPVPRLALIAAAVGAAGSGIGLTVSGVVLYAKAHEFANAAHQTNAGVLDAQSDPLFLAGAFIGDILGIGLAVAIILIALNARRAGLLRQFMGIVGMFVGATIVLRQLDPFGAVEAFWFGALAMLFMNRMPTPRPQAWSVPEAVPWPTPQQQREAARRARGEPERPARGRGRGAAAPDANGAPPDANGAPPDERTARVPAPRAPQPRRDDAAPGRPHPSSKKRKRKRR